MEKKKNYEGLSVQEMEQECQNLKKELFNMKFQLSLGQFKNTAMIKKVRRDIARLKLSLRDRAGGIN